MELYEPLWGNPETPLNLKPDQVDVWRISQKLPQFALNKLRQLLSPDEQATLNSLQYAEEKEHYITSRGTLRKLLSLYLKINPADIRFTYGPHGKPQLECPNKDLQFNVSHSGDITVVAVTQIVRVGVDIEFLNSVSDIPFLSGHFLTGREKKAYSELDDTEKRGEFLACWTLKEACIKAAGLTIRRLIPKLDVCFNPQLITIPTEDGNDNHGEPCYALTFTPAPQYVASIIVDLPQAHLRFYNY